jgi:hypothetical protein
LGIQHGWTPTANGQLPSKGAQRRDTLKDAVSRHSPPVTSRVAPVM